MPITPASCKQKGRKLQQWVRDTMLKYAPELQPDDILSTSMGAGGEDCKLSPAARAIYPITIECKNRAKMAVYGDYEQAAGHGPHEPVVVIKANFKKPLVVVDAEYFFKNFRNKHGN